MSTQPLASAFDRLKTAIDEMKEPFYQSQLRLAATVLGSSIADMNEQPTPAQISDAEFAFGDITSIASEVPAQDEERLNPAIDAIRNAIAALREARPLPAEVVVRARALQEMLRERRSALERQGFRFEEEEAAHVPHHPRELCLPARRLQRDLAAEGFAMRSLEKLVDSPDEFAYHDVADLIAELDSVAGSQPG
ncbi:MAG TPA: hypothetical protein VMS56_06475 [Thermoanaerobaculia bacterium]|nr:hypothetical protein [Thermoanaerobaculia bacterium]